jgi:hypothetical protein
VSGQDSVGACHSPGDSHSQIGFIASPPPPCHLVSRACSSNSPPGCPFVLPAALSSRCSLDLLQLEKPGALGVCLDDLWGRVDSLDIRARELLLGVPVAGECEGKQVGAPPVGSGRVCWQCVCVRVGRVMLLHRHALLPHAHPPAHPPTCVCTPPGLALLQMTGCVAPLSGLTGRACLCPLTSGESASGPAPVGVCGRGGSGWLSGLPWLPFPPFGDSTAKPSRRAVLSRRAPAICCLAAGETRRQMTTASRRQT